MGIAAPGSEVLDKLTTLEGLAGWWTPDVSGDPTSGGTLEFCFGSPEPSAVMRVVSVTAAQVVWQCIGGPDEWSATR